MQNENSLVEKTVYLAYQLLLKEYPDHNLLALVSFDDGKNIRTSQKFHSKYFKDYETYTLGLLRYINDILEILNPENISENDISRELPLPSYAIGGSTELYGPVEIN